jgi:hypothetical protein
MNRYNLFGMEIDSIDLKCLVVSRGLKVDSAVYRHFAAASRLDVNPLTCNCFLLPDGTVCQLTDMGFHLKYLSGILSWNNLKLLKYASQLQTDFSLRIRQGVPALFHRDDFVCTISFPPDTDFYQQTTSTGTRYIGNAVLQGLDWVSFQCLWPCEYAAGGKPCEFCFSGGDFETLARKRKTLPAALSAADVAEIVSYAIQKTGMNSVQITGGSTYGGETEAAHIRAYLTALQDDKATAYKTNELLLYITPPKDQATSDEYFALGASRIACSLEVWDEERAKVITPGKMAFAGRDAYVNRLTGIAEKHGPGKAFSNFIIGLESFDTLKEGATELARRGILPTASVWMPMGRPVMGSMVPPDLDYYRRTKELFAALYEKYDLIPPGGHGLNVCIEYDIHNCHI